MISVTEQGLEEALRFKVKASLSLEYLPAKAISSFDDKTAQFFSSLISGMANSNGGTIFVGVKSLRKSPKNLEPLSTGLWPWGNGYLVTGN